MWVNEGEFGSTWNLFLMGGAQGTEGGVNIEAYAQLQPEGDTSSQLSGC